MSMPVGRKWLLTLSTVSCFLVGRAAVARADEPKNDTKEAPKKGTPAEEFEGNVEFDEPESETEGEAEADEAGKGGEHKKHAKHEEAGVKVGADLVLGWGNAPVVIPSALGGGASPQTQTLTLQDKVSTNVQSFIFSAGVEVTHHLELGVRAPLTFATFNPNGVASRNTVGVGNVELEGEYGGNVAHGLRLVGALGLALPTADGDDPTGLSNAPVGSVDQGSFDHYAMNKAAAFARGAEDNALFEPNRFGIIPKIGLLYRTHGLSLEPYVKVENLVGTSSNLANGYVGELVGGLRVGYWVHKEFEVAVRGWFNAGFAGGDDDKKTSVAVEPQIVLRFGPVRPYLGLLLPVAGPPHDYSFIGARIGVSASF